MHFKRASSRRQGTKPLRKFIEENEDWLEVTPLKGRDVAPDGQPSSLPKCALPNAKTTNLLSSLSLQARELYFLLP